MNLPSLELALAGLGIAETALDRFLDECEAVNPGADDGTERDDSPEYLDHLRDLVPLDPDEAFAWRYQLRAMLAIFECLLLPARIRRARVAQRAMLKQLAAHEKDE